MRRKFKAGTTSLTLSIVVYDTTSTTGAGLAGLTHTTSGLILEYRRAGQSTWTQLGVATGLVSKNLGDYVSGGICANGDRVGRYEIGIPDAAIAAGVSMVEICLRGAASMHPVDIELELDAVDYQDAAAFGLSRIDATIGSRSTLTAGGVRTELATELGRIDATIGSRATPTNITQASGVTLAPTTGLGNQTANITGNLSGSVGSVTGSVGSVASGVTVSDKTGFSLLAGTGLGAQNGSVASVTKVDELGAGALTANGAVDAIPTAVWNALLASYTTANSFGARIIRSANSNNTVQISGGGSNHIFAVLHDAEPNSIPEDAFVDGALSARVIATDAIDSDAMAASANTEIANAVAATQALSRLDSMIESDGAGQFRFDTIALDQAPAGGGGGGTDWTANERSAFRTILGFNSSGDILDPSSGILDEIRDKTALITSGGTVYVTSPVTATGQIASPLIIGDDYLAANGRRFRWTVALPSGYVIGTSTARFGMRYEDEQGLNTFVATGTVTDATGGNVHLDFDVAKTVTGTLRPGWYEWSVEIVSGSGVEITRVKSGKNVEWQGKQT
jgi:hypothetical protein